MSAINPGDFVTIDGQDNVGEVLSIRGNNVEVAIGIMKVNVKLNKVSLAKPPEEEKKTVSETSTFIDTKEKMMHFKFELDLRGKMKDDVMVELVTWIDDAILLGVEEAKIIHGRGTGVIKDTVRSMLRKYKEVEKVGDEESGRRDSVTVVKFKL